MSTRLQIAGLLAERAEELGMSQSDLAREMGQNASVICSIFNGKRGASMEMSDRIANALGVRIETRLEEL